MIELRNLSKSFITSSGQVDALQHVSLTVNDGDIYGIIGMSGAGKSTLVRCINMLERPTEGSVLLNGRDLGALNKKEIQLMRRKVTMIFQSFNLLMQRTCLQNAHPTGQQLTGCTMAHLCTHDSDNSQLSHRFHTNAGSAYRVSPSSFCCMRRHNLNNR